MKRFFVTIFFAGLVAINPSGLFAQSKYQYKIDLTKATDHTVQVELLTPAINQSSQQQVLGIQANLWTETIPTEQQFDYMLFPRIAALAEAAWTSAKDYPGFKERLVKHLVLYKQAGIQFYNPF